MDGLEASRGMSRRSLVAGAAWSVPILLAATAAPARASSGEPSVVIHPPAPFGAVQFQTLTLSFSNLPTIAAGDPDGPSDVFLEVCLPSGMGVTAITSLPAVDWSFVPPDYEPGGTITWNLSEIPAGSLELSFSLALEPVRPLTGSIEVFVYLAEILEPVFEDVDYQFGSEPVEPVQCGF